ncbi:hypothetical protein PG996_001019 [Apiospora saccharicola]|uniref:PrsW family intramembrane metalloprotease n=1 Tax=Apiospora saccharicola TaxID=335842 RepID=A0ABR1WFM9_9PEZI
MSAFLGLVGHRLANLPPALTASCTSLALGLTTAAPPPSPSSSSQKPQASAQAPTQPRGRPSSIAGTMLFMGTLGSTGVILFQLLSVRAMLTLLFGGAEPAKVYVREFLRSAGGRAHLDATLSAAEVQTRADMTRDWRYGLFCALFGVVSAGVPEEILKYLPAATVRWWRARKAAKAETKSTPRKGEAETAASGEMSPLEFVNYTVAAGIGFAIFENIGVIYGSLSGGNSAAELLLLLAERTISALPGHVLCAALSGIRGASIYRRRRSADDGAAGKRKGGFVSGIVDTLSAILPSVLFHGVFDSALLGLSALCGHPGWVRPADPWVQAGGYGMVVVMQGSLALMVRAAWREEAREQALEERTAGKKKAV